MDFDTYTNAALLGGGVADDPYAKAIGKNLPGLMIDDDVLDAYKRLISSRQKKVKPTTRNTRKTRTKGGGLIGALLKFGITGTINRWKELHNMRKEQKAELERLRAKKAAMGGKRVRGGSFKSFISDVKTLFSTPIMPLNVALLIKKKQREKEIAKLKKEVGEGGSLFGPPSLSSAQKKTLNDFFRKVAKKDQLRERGGGTAFYESIKEELLKSKKPIPNGFDINKERREEEEHLQELIKKYNARHGNAL